MYISWSGALRDVDEGQPKEPQIYWVARKDSVEGTIEQILKDKKVFTKWALRKGASSGENAVFGKGCCVSKILQK